MLFVEVSHTNMSFLFITSFKILTVASLLLALSKVIVHTLFSSPQSSKELKIASEITTPECGGGTSQKFIIRFCNFQLESTKWQVRHIYPIFCQDFQKSVVRLTLLTLPSIVFNFFFSNSKVEMQSFLAVLREIFC